MSVVLFLVILAVLVLVHECGHFVVAKLSGMRVLEFGLGFPPNLWKKKIGETEYSFNAIPFGGFVKIYGEDPDGTEEATLGDISSRKFGEFHRAKQVATLAGGVVFNALFAWLLFSATFMAGALVPIASVNSSEYMLSNIRTIVTSVRAGSPAEAARIQSGDSIESMCDETKKCVMSPNDEEVPAFVASSTGKVAIEIRRLTGTTTILVTPTDGIVAGRRAIGIGIQTVGEARLPFLAAFREGALNTWNLARAMVVGVGELISRAVVGGVSMDEVAGPIGIAGAVGDAARFGFSYLLGFAALISLNLAVLNIMPFPALDGGRIAVVLIETVVRRPLKPSVMNIIHSVGFAILMLLMLAITWHDIARLVMG